MKKHYLIKETEYFVSPHQDIDTGDTTKKIVFTDKYNNLDLSKIYNEDLEEVDSEEYEGSEDGYNRIYTEVKIVEITEAQANEYKKVIEDYNKI
jgi:hypothetical protein